MSRTYTEALRLLFQLQSNKQITTLFDASKTSSPKPSTQDLNALALPEMRDWLRRAGYTPSDLSRLRHIHVAGTKGKGSVCAFATAMLQRYGRVGTYTSPHLVSPRERIAIDGQPVAQDVFARAFFELWDRFTEAARKEGMAAQEAEGPASKPFFFRYLTILAWHIFLTQGLESVVLEVGIGGEYDATNVVPPEAVSAAVVTQLGIDHVAMLGDTVEKIAWHKAGVFKPGVHGFVRKLDDQPAVMDVLRDRAKEKGTVLVEIDDELVECWGGVESGLAGGFQKYNQALAVLAVRKHLGMEIDPATALTNLPDEMMQGLRYARLRGRCEMLEREGVSWHLDGAHTKESLEQVARWFAQSLGTSESAVLVFNQQERNASELLDGFLSAVRQETGRADVFTHAIFTRNDLEPPTADEVRDMEVQKSAAQMMQSRIPSCRATTADNLQAAVEEASRVQQRVLVTGSMHLVGGILRTLEPASLL